MQTQPTLTAATRRRLAALLLHAHGIVTRTDRRWIARLLPAVRAEDPELACYLEGLVVA